MTAIDLFWPRTYLDDCLSVTLGSAHSDHVALSVHKNALSLHVTLFDIEAIRCVNDGHLLNR